MVLRPPRSSPRRHSGRSLESFGACAARIERGLGATRAWRNGRRASLRSWWALPVGVQVPPPAPDVDEQRSTRLGSPDGRHRVRVQDVRQQLDAGHQPRARGARSRRRRPRPPCARPRVRASGSREQLAPPPPIARRHSRRASRARRRGRGRRDLLPRRPCASARRGGRARPRRPPARSSPGTQCPAMNGGSSHSIAATRGRGAPATAA